VTQRSDRNWFGLYCDYFRYQLRHLKLTASSVYSHARALKGHIESLNHKSSWYRRLFLRE